MFRYLLLTHPGRYWPMHLAILAKKRKCSGTSSRRPQSSTIATGSPSTSSASRAMYVFSRFAEKKDRFTLIQVKYSYIAKVETLAEDWKKIRTKVIDLTFHLSSLHSRFSKSAGVLVRFPLCLIFINWTRGLRETQNWVRNLNLDPGTTCLHSCLRARFEELNQCFCYSTLSCISWPRSRQSLRWTFVCSAIDTCFEKNSCVFQEEHTACQQRIHFTSF